LLKEGNKIGLRRRSTLNFIAYLIFCLASEDNCQIFVITNNCIFNSSDNVL